MDGRADIDGGFVPDLAAWDAWRPEEIAARLAGLEGVPWCVVGGWALDLFLGGQRREHEDLEIAVPADRFDPIATALPDLAFFTVGSGMAWPLEGSGALVREHHHQTWGRDRETGLWRVDVMREPHDGDTWIARRDGRVRMRYADLILRTAEGIPYARPETVLLFKAKATRPKDEDDFAAVLPHLSGEARRWLRAALATVHPGHTWLDVV